MMSENENTNGKTGKGNRDMRKKQLIGSAIAIFFGAVTIQAADVPLGHKDFYPTAQRPIGFRGDGNGAFPGATPVTEWREGDVAAVDMRWANWGDAGGNAQGTFSTKKVWTFTNNKSVNIVWKTEMPGFSNSSPVVTAVQDNRGVVSCLAFRG
jgi:hypothetical protein